MTALKYINSEDLQQKHTGKRVFIANDPIARDFEIKAVTTVEAKEGYGKRVDLSKGELRKAVIANTLKDRHSDVFTLETLQHFANQIKAGITGLQLFHDSTLPVGRLVDAEVKAIDGGTGFELEAVIYIHKGFTLPGQTVTVLEAVDDGVLIHVYVGFTGMKYAYIEPGGDVPGYWEISPNPAHVDGGLLFEVSLVNMGAQIGAEIKEFEPNRPTRVAYKNMKTIYNVNGTAFEIEGVANADGAVEVKGLKEFSEAFTKALAETTEAKTAAATAQKEIDAVREKCIADVVNLTRASEKPILVEDAQKMTTSDLVSKAIALAGEAVETKAAPQPEHPKSYNYK